MTIEEKTQYDIDREAARISALSSGKIDLYIFSAKKYYLFVEVKWMNNLNLHLL